MRVTACSGLLLIAQVPYRLLKSFHKIQQRLVRELEKKFSGKDVVIIANRRIMAPTTSGQSNARPRSRTLTAVHEETLLDLCYPTGERETGFKKEPPGCCQTERTCA